MRRLCIGSNTEDTDIQSSRLAKEHNSTNWGLITGPDNNLDNNGYYHTSIVDLTQSEIVTISKHFDHIIFLDQPIEEWSHPDSFERTWELAKHLPKEKIIYQNRNQFEAVDYFSNLVKTNKSFCIFPFIELLAQNGHTTVCCRSHTPVTTIDKITDWSTDPDYKIIRDKMLQGSSVPEHCSSCYKYEQLGMQSARQQETVEWANRLGIRSIDDLKKITDPAYYEVRPSNVCNLACRSCSPELSSQLEKEFIVIGLHDSDVKFQYTNFDFIKIDKIKKLYVAGGEPTAMVDMVTFMEKCVQLGTTDFEFIINTNAHKFSNRMKELFKQFKNLSFIVSIDGYREVNDYVRWLSNWENTIKNAQYLVEQGHRITFNTVVSMWTVSRWHELCLFLDSNFPNSTIHGSLAESDNDIMSPLNYPDYDLLKANFIKLKTIGSYRNDQLFRSFVDSLIEHTSLTDIDQLTKFFEYNDILDKSRGVQLKNYIPELDQYREMCYNKA